MDDDPVLRRVRWLMAFFLMALVISGATAIPLRAELGLLDSIAGKGTSLAAFWPSLGEWISRVHAALTELDNRYPFLAYGYDWLAFGHFAIALFVVGAFRDPRRNLWIIEAGMIACLLVIPYALIMGQVRGIPLFWRFIDTLFGIVGVVPLWFARRWLMRGGSTPLERA